MVHIIEASAEKMCPIGSAPYILYIGAEVKSLVDSIKELISQVWLIKCNYEISRLSVG